ncbi:MULTISPECIES: DMT family transporter [Cyanophyceae]|uniref:DMT family transporter n=1 Tax=Cyanophyceae TaxID=3028117 RepID=UPI0016841780|nr:MULTISPECIES: DMT family transporter [Cyanophyceae]MBD1914634.1 DMT family transporter [Phormidium sp. FACHB-77]MBD2030553.1 DMT family transporter [Phormidium sp. FACHB-322]MBD2052406.1 DMT family transporter [Leptolyngbya sp. FACHB-60]
MTRATSALIQVHASVFLFGLSGLFGKFLALPATVIVLGRTGFAALSLGLVLTLGQRSARLGTAKDRLGMVLLGALLAFHWVSFFLSIQLATVAVGLLTFSSFPVFVTVLEPLLFKTLWRWRDGAIAALVVLGVALAIPEYRLGSATTLGAVWGLLSGLSFALLQLLNKGYRQRYTAVAIAFYQNLFACLSLLVVTPIVGLTLTTGEIGLLLVLGVLCTALAHTLFIESLGKLRAQTASVISTLEPVYGIALAALLLREVPTLRTLVGGAVVLTTIIWASWLPQTTTKLG